MTSAMMMNGTGYGGVRTHNGQSPFNFGMSHLNHGDCSPLFLYQYRQASTAWERLANTFSSIIRSIQSRSSCSMVTLIRGLFSTIEYDSIISNNINISEMNVAVIGLNPIGVTTNDRTQPISGSYAGHPDHNEVRGPVRGGEDAADRVSGAHRPGDAAEPLHPQAGAGVRVADADRRVPRGIIPVRGGSGAIGDGREVAA